MMPANPFFHRGPIRDRSYFFGRERLLARALAFLGEGQSLALVGPRRIGKTSFLFQVMSLAAQQRSSPLRCCYFDCESWGRASAEQIYGLLADAVRQGMRAGPIQPAPAPFAGLETAAREAAAQGIQPVLIFDEFEALSANPQLDSDFFASLRALAMEHRMAYLTVSTQPLLELTYARVSPRSSPFFNFFALLRIGLFARAESVALLRDLSTRGGVPFEAPLIDQLIEQVSDHPFFLQMIGDYAFEQLLRGEAQQDLADRLLQGPFYAEAADHWAAFWRNLSPEEQRLLALFPILAPGQPSAVRRLEDCGLVARAADGSPAIVSQGFRAFVAEQAVDGITQVPPITIAPERRVALLNGRALALSPQQFDLFAYLIAHRERVVTREELCATIWQHANASSFESLRTTLNDLRAALGTAKYCIQNMRGQGYQFAPGGSADQISLPPTTA